MKGGERKTTDAKVGDNLLDVIVENDVDIDGFGLYIFILSVTHLSPDSI